MPDVPKRRNFNVPMRDGVLLSTDVYLPGAWEEEGLPRRPVILERTPYDKSGVSRSEITLANSEPRTREQIAEYFACHGYVVVMQDCRGCYDSGGVFEKYVNEARDGLDTQTWILSQEWCNGRVGTMGFSYGAHTQCALAAMNPVGLACMFIDSGGFSSAYHGGVRQGGAFEMKQATWAYRQVMKRCSTFDPAQHESAPEIPDIAEWMRKPDWAPGSSPLSVAPEFENYFFDQWRRGLFDDYWKQPGLYAEGYYDSFPDVPIAILGSWYDPYVRTCITNFLGLREHRSAPLHLVMGPWTHGDRSQTFAGDVDFGPSATLDGNLAEDYFALRLAWFDRYLKGASGVANVLESPVSYFCMGGGRGVPGESGRLQHGGCWRTSAVWPPDGSRPLQLFLGENGRLLDTASNRDDGAVQFRFDPRDPVPTIGGAVTSGGQIMSGGAFDQVQTPETFAVREIATVRPLQQRPDVTAFRSEPLSEKLTIAGPVVAELWVSSDCPDTDFTLKLIDEYPKQTDLPEGYAMNITDGIFRMRYRDGWEREVPLENDEIYMIRIEAFDTCNTFTKGHRIRVDISSSNYPHFDINPNTGRPIGDMKNSTAAVNTVHCSRHHPSRVILNVTA